eukprot:CAMPEP_0178438988 /NCGR_PEP_ID=MMETSP0689_2-20121128/35902_1 /TAXON_ID=160604 /ORGANISM="Amphidinium massartii, Strain CS-259" /LENGTH=111 /DNA_ID=CAMNT_0020061459 /DNA_START=436 /DNA_END=771 /DNA_ORIENTATION=-
MRRRWRALESVVELRQSSRMDAAWLHTSFAPMDSAVGTAALETRSKGSELYKMRYAPLAATSRRAASAVKSQPAGGGRAFCHPKATTTGAMRRSCTARLTSAMRSQVCSGQ